MYQLLVICKLLISLFPFLLSCPFFSRYYFYQCPLLKSSVFQEYASKAGSWGPGRASEDSLWYRVLGAGALSFSILLSQSGGLCESMQPGRKSCRHPLPCPAHASFLPAVPAELSLRGRVAGLALCWERVRNQGFLFLLRTAA